MIAVDFSFVPNRGTDRTILTISGGIHSFFVNPGRFEWLALKSHYPYYVQTSRNQCQYKHMAILPRFLAKFRSFLCVEHAVTSSLTESVGIVSISLQGVYGGLLCEDDRKSSEYRLRSDNCVNKRAVKPF